MHEDCTKENDPYQHLEKLKFQCFSNFRDCYLEKASCQNMARDFDDLCLKPALQDYVQKRLGMEIMNNILNEYSSRKFFQCTVVKMLLEEENFDNY